MTSNIQDEFGNFADTEYAQDIFYAGKVYFDDLNVPTFINLFTIVLE